MPRSRFFPGLSGILSGTMWVLGSVSVQAQSDPPTTPLPRTTTLEKLVNPVGLSEPPKLGWHTDFIGAGRGDFDLSFGPDKLHLRNLILGGTVDLAPGLRARVQLRREEGNAKFFNVDSDEAYLEAYNQYRGENFNFGVNLKVGRTRYVRFPYPDAISQFDIPPGVSDMFRGPRTDYRDLLFQTELALHSGWGLNWSGLANVVSGRPRANVLQAYGFYRSDFGRGWRFEGRAGWLNRRQESYWGAARQGFNVYVGKQIGEFNVGLLYEKRQGEREYSGLMVQFRPGPVTRALGKVSFDYSRQVEGFSLQIPVWHGRLRQSRFVRSGDILVGEVRAVRVRTIFQQSFQRNQYEHRLASWGETSDPSLHCVVTEEPWFLQSEALVSPHLTFDAKWERDRQGPGQFMQRVTYRFYRPFKKSNTDT
jgi:hypothetical protein